MQIDKFTLNVNTNLKEAMKVIDQNGRGIIFLVDEKNSLRGSLTDGDIRRWLINDGNLKVAAKEIMNPKLEYLTNSSYSKAKELLKSKKIDAIPIIDDSGVIQSIVFDHDEFKQKELMNIMVVIMAGGKGTRLKPYTEVIPKPLIPIGDKTITEWIINRFQSFGANNFKMIINYKENLIRAYFSDLDKDFQINLITETSYLGTGGGLSLLDDDISSDFVLTNCDIIIDVNYNNIYEVHRKNENVITIVAAAVETSLPYGVLEVDQKGVLTGLKEKPFYSNLVNTGLYIVNSKILSYIEPNKPVDFTDIIEFCLENKQKVGIYPISNEDWYDIGSLDLLKMTKLQMLDGISR